MVSKSLIIPLFATLSPFLWVSLAFPPFILSESTIIFQKPENLQQIAKNITVRIYVGDSSGSGVLINRNEQTYTVITNTHVVKWGQPYRIQTPDGIIHNATLQAAEDALRGNDLALLQFKSPNNYNLATLAPGESLTVNQIVYAAGFSYDSFQLNISEGKVTLVTPKPILGGYQIGFSNPTQQGMSGGVLLNQEGQLVGILGKGNAIFEDAYHYQDGTRPDSTLLQQMQHSSFAIPLEPVNFLVKLYSQDDTKTSVLRQVNQIAAKITVRIDAKTGFNGSGVIVGRNGQSYYVLTADHVVQGLTRFQVITPDGKSYLSDQDRVKTFEGVDIALVEFSSSETYQVATLADYSLGTLKTNQQGLDFESPLIFVSGFPMVTSGNPSRRLTSGVVFPKYHNLFATQDRYSLSTGIELVYNALSLPGMSGGAVLDQKGRVIGINVGAEHEEISQQDESESREVLYFGNSLGIPIKTFLGQLQKENLNPQWFNLETNAPKTYSNKEIQEILLSVFSEQPPSKSSSAIDWFNYGKLQARMGQYEKALEAFEEVIKRNPRFYQAYYAQGRILYSKEVNQVKKALTAFEKATEIEPNFFLGWYWQAQVLVTLEGYLEALVAIDKAMEIRPQEPKFYALRAIILANLERDPEAEENYTEAIKLKPNPQSYFLRGVARKQWGDLIEAIADYNKAIEIQPNWSYPYIGRSLAFSRSNPALALKDAETAIQLDPDNIHSWVAKASVLFYLEDYQGVVDVWQKIIDTFFQGKQQSEVGLYDHTISDAYLNLANAYWQLGQKEKAIAGYTQMIEVEPNKARSYYFRGLALTISQKSCALVDFNKAIEIESNNAEFYNARALCFEVDNKQDQALADYQKVVEITHQKIQQYPYNPRYYSLRGAALRKLGDEKGAVENIQKSQELEAEGFTGSRETNFLIEEFRNKQQRMQAYYTQKIDQDSHNSQLYFYRAIVAHNLRDYQTALADFNRCLKLNPNHSEAYYRRGIIYQKQGKNEQALGDYNLALEKNKNLVAAIIKIGHIFYEMGDSESALQQWQKAIEIDSSLAEAQLAIAIVIYSTGETEKGLELAQKALILDEKLGNVEYLQEHLWGEKLIREAQQGILQ